MDERERMLAACRVDECCTSVGGNSARLKSVGEALSALEFDSKDIRSLLGSLQEDMQTGKTPLVGIIEERIGEQLSAMDSAVQSCHVSVVLEAYFNLRKKFYPHIFLQ